MQGKPKLFVYKKGLFIDKKGLFVDKKQPKTATKPPTGGTGQRAPRAQTRNRRASGRAHAPDTPRKHQKPAATSVGAGSW